ncbi:MAG: sigma-70 family RNA polymerase sigma factor [Candidatus Omnitrophota bacterium]
MTFEGLVKKISPTLKRITYKLNGHFSFFNDEDLFQEALLRLWLDFQRGKLDDKTDSYILQGCYFHLKNYLRKARDKARLVSIDTLVAEEGLNLDEMLASDRQLPACDDLDEEMLSERMEKLGLSGREKDILSLSMEGLTVREIGKRLGISHVMVIKLKAKIKSKCIRFREEVKNSYQM